MPKAKSKRVVLDEDSQYYRPEFQEMVPQMVQQALDERDNAASNPTGGSRHESLPQVGGPCVM